MSIIRDDDSPWFVLGVLLACLAGVGWMLIPAPDVQLVVEGPRVQFEPGTIRARITVERNPNNRALIVGVLAADFESSSYEQLDGEDAPRTRWRTYPGVPAGEYIVYAALQTSDGDWNEARDTVRVLSRGF